MNEPTRDDGDPFTARETKALQAEGYEAEACPNCDEQHDGPPCNAEHAEAIHVEYCDKPQGACPICWPDA